MPRIKLGSKNPVTHGETNNDKPTNYFLHGNLYYLIPFERKLQLLHSNHPVIATTTNRVIETLLSAVNQDY